jgi:Bacteriophage lambda head decoration protein D
MTDITVESSTYLPADRPWLLFEAVGHQQPSPTDSGLINFALFTSGTHYPDGFIPSGVLLGRVTTGSRLGPYDNTATDGRQTAVGFLYNATRVPADTAKKVAVAFVDVFAVVWESRLPSGHGLDAAAKAELPLLKFRA